MNATLNRVRPRIVHSKGGQDKGFMPAVHLRNTLHFYRTSAFIFDGNAYTCFPLKLNGKHHLAFELSNRYSSRNPIGCGEVMAEDLKARFAFAPPVLISGTPQYLENIFNKINDWQTLKVVVTGMYAPNRRLKKLVEKKSNADFFATYGSTAFMDAFTTLRGMYDQGYYVHQGMFSKPDGELLYRRNKFENWIHTGDTGEITEFNGRQFIGVESVRKLK